MSQFNRTLLLSYGLIGLFTLIFWGITLGLWYLAPRIFYLLPDQQPSFLLTLLALLIPMEGYWVLAQSEKADTTATFKPVPYIFLEIVTLVLWIVAVWLWLWAYTVFLLVGQASFLAVFTIFLLLHWVLWRQIRGPIAVDQPGVVGWMTSWIAWLGNGETHRGSLVMLVILFWSVLYWSVPYIQKTGFVVAFAFWGLVTTFGTIFIRALFFRRTSLPGQEVPGGASTKSRP